jgi:hypothetical protein
MALINKNGKSYDGGDVHIAMFSSIDWECTEITYNTSQEHQPNHSLGSNKQSSYSMGKISHESSMTLRLKSGSTIEKAAGKSILAIKPFHINVTYLNDDNTLVNDTLLAKFQDTGREVNGDMDIKKQYKLFVLDIDYNNV